MNLGSYAENTWCTRTEVCGIGNGSVRLLVALIAGYLLKKFIDLVVDRTWEGLSEKAKDVVLQIGVAMINTLIAVYLLALIGAGEVGGPLMHFLIEAYRTALFGAAELVRIVEPLALSPFASSLVNAASLLVVIASAHLVVRRNLPGMLARPGSSG